MVFVSATSPDKDPPPLAAIDPGDIYNTRAFWDDDEVARTINGLTVFAHVSFSGCRARSPSELKAEVEHAGQRYTFRERDGGWLRRCLECRSMTPFSS